MLLSSTELANTSSFLSMTFFASPQEMPPQCGAVGFLQQCCHHCLLLCSGALFAGKARAAKTKMPRREHESLLAMSPLALLYPANGMLVQHIKAFALLVCLIHISCNT